MRGIRKCSGLTLLLPLPYSGPFQGDSWWVRGVLLVLCVGMEGMEYFWCSVWVWSVSVPGVLCGYGGSAHAVLCRVMGLVCSVG
jgi:hypothetical protein